MSDLISRADAIEAIASRDETDGTVKVFSGREVNAILASLPSASARPMGRWVESITGNGWNEWSVYTCSNCGYIPTGEGKQYWNFCPNCGADMIGEDHEGNT